MQKTKECKDLTTLLRQRKSKNKLNSKNLSEVIIKNVYLYKMKNNESKFIVVEISTKDELYSKKYVLDFIGEQIDKNYINKQFENLYNYIDKTVYTYKFPKNRQMLRLNKPVNSSKIWKYISNFTLDISTHISFLFLVLIAIFTVPLLNISTLFIYLLSITVYFPMAIGLSHYLSDYVNKNRFIMCELDKDLSKMTNVTNEYTKKLNINVNNDTIPFENYIVTVNVLNNKDVEIKNDKAKWIFESDEDVISKEFIEFYNDYGGEFDTGDEIDVQIAPYNNNILDDNMYLSDCGEWILKSDIY